jgi:hypothetical protein
MTRRRFKNGVSQQALMRKEVKDVVEHKALASLADEFRENITFYGPEVAPDCEEMQVAMFRSPNDEPNPTDGARLLFADRNNYRGDPEEISRARMARFWESCLNHVRPGTLDFYKAGPVIWDDLEFSVAPEWTAELLGLKQADAAMTRAHQAAPWCLRL